MFLESPRGAIVSTDFINNTCMNQGGAAYINLPVVLNIQRE